MHDDSHDPNYDEGGDFVGEDGFSFREVEIREQDRFLPVANIARIMKKVLPTNAKIAKDAKEGIQECLSEFISFITSEASDKCQQEKRKTINGDDLLWAMSALGFDKYIEPLKIYLAKYRESVKGEKPEKKPAARPKEPTFPSMHAQPKTMSGMSMIHGMGGPNPGAAMHQGGDSMGEYGSYHHQYGSSAVMPPGLQVDPYMAPVGQHRGLQAPGARIKDEMDPSQGGMYQDVSSGMSGGMASGGGRGPSAAAAHGMQYVHQMPYEHDPHRVVGNGPYASSSDGFSM